MRARELLLSGWAACALAGCGDAGSTAGTQKPATARSAGTITESTPSCAGLPQLRRLASARLVFRGRFLPGPTVGLDGRAVLVSPASMRVGRYIKGRGPTTVTVMTAVLANRVVAEDGIAPQAGEDWLIYTNSPHGPYDTSICSGSRPVAPRPPEIGPVIPPAAIRQASRRR